MSRWDITDKKNNEKDIIIFNYVGYGIVLY